MFSTKIKDKEKIEKISISKKFYGRSVRSKFLHGGWRNWCKWKRWNWIKKMSVDKEIMNKFIKKSEKEKCVFWFVKSQLNNNTFLIFNCCYKNIHIFTPQIKLLWA